MNSKASVERIQAKREPGLRPLRGCGCRDGSGHLFGLAAERMSPKAQIFAALAVLAPVVISVVFLVAFIPGLWWIFTMYFWVAFPVFGLLIRGLTGVSERKTEIASGRYSGEKELLEALRREGEITAARAAIETSLSVSEATRMLKELAEAGHLQVRVRGGGLFYTLWGK